jgi:small conductance mechanosensitive channel
MPAQRAADSDTSRLLASLSRAQRATNRIALSVIAWSVCPQMNLNEKSSNKCRGVLAVCALASVLMSTPGVAGAAEVGPPQQAAPAEKPSRVFDAKLERAEALKAKLTELRSLASEATGADAAALELSIEAVQVERVALLQEISASAIDEEADASERARARAIGETEMPRIAPPLLEYVDGIERRVTDTNERAVAASGAEALALAQQVSALVERVDVGYKLLAQQIELMASLGLDAGSLRSQLEERLERRAALASSRLALAEEESARLRAGLAKNPDDADAKIELAIAEERIGASIAALRSTIDVMKAAKVDATDYQQRLIEATGEIDARSLNTGVAVGMIGKWLRQVQAWLGDNGLNIVLKCVLFVLLIAVFRLLAAGVRGVVARALDSSRLQVSALLRRMVVQWAGSVVMLVGILVALAQLGISVGPLLAGLGIAGFIVGFALQDTLSNFASGMMILLYRPYDIGDVVEAAGVLGTVSQMNLVSTTILTGDHQTLVVPNTKIWGDVIRNITAQGTRRVDLTFGIGYGDDIERAERVLKDIVASHEKVLDEPAPVVEVHTLGESSVDFVVRPWVKSSDYWRVYWDITRAVKKRFDEEGISIPFPQRDLHLVVEPPKPPAAAEGGAESP